jgi:chromate transporter
MTNAPPGVSALFLGFLKIGLMGFGGVASVARHVLVEERRWLSEREYAELIGLGQVLPGANTVNAAVMIGDRFAGMPGSLAALLGLMAMPLVVVTALALVYAGLAAAHPDLVVAVAGAAAAAAGLVIGTALKMARNLRPSPAMVAVGLAACAGTAALRLPLPLVVVALAPVGVAVAAFERRRALALKTRGDGAAARDGR